VPVTQTRALHATGMPFDDALREACIGRVRRKLMTAATALTLLALPTFYARVERWRAPGR
jgi:heavy metal efflux system protein